MYHGTSMDAMMFWSRSCFLIILCISRATNGQEITIDSHLNKTLDEEHVSYKETSDKSAPPGFNDKYHGQGNNSSRNDPVQDQGHFWLVPPFIIGASVAIIVYIICNCFYLHCYAHKKIKKLAVKHFSSPILLTDEASSGAYQAFTPIVYNDGQDESGQFLFYQPYNDNEWDFSTDESSSRSSQKSKSSSVKRTFLSQKLFKKKRKASTSTSSAPEELQQTDGGKKAANICLVPYARSQSVPEKVMAPKKMIYAPVVIPRVQSLKTTARGSVKGPGDGVPQSPLLIIGKGEGIGRVLFRQSSVPCEGGQNAGPSEGIAGAGGHIEPAGSSVLGGTAAAAGKADTQEETTVTFHLEESAGEGDKELRDIHEDNEEGEDVV